MQFKHLSKVPTATAIAMRRQAKMSCNTSLWQKPRLRSRFSRWIPVWPRKPKQEWKKSTKKLRWPTKWIWKALWTASSSFQTQ